MMFDLVDAAAVVVAAAAAAEVPVVLSASFVLSSIVALVDMR